MVGQGARSRPARCCPESDLCTAHVCVYVLYYVFIFAHRCGCVDVWMCVCVCVCVDRIGRVCVCVHVCTTVGTVGTHGTYMISGTWTKIPRIVSRVPPTWLSLGSTEYVHTHLLRTSIRMDGACRHICPLPRTSGGAMVCHQSSNP
jgi:hypothetical protein